MKSIVSILLLFAAFTTVFSDDKGQIYSIAPDSTVIFNSPNPMMQNSNTELAPNTWGVNVSLNSGGFALGINRNYHLFRGATIGLELHGARGMNTDELELWSPIYGQYLIPNKINRVFYVPLMLKVQFEFLKNQLFDSFTPNFMAGAGPSLILSMPYMRYDSNSNGGMDMPVEFFDAFDDVDIYLRWGGFVGLGSKFSTSETGQIEISVKYYYIPFGGEGIESVEGKPIKTFGGFYLDFNLLWY